MFERLNNTNPATDNTWAQIPFMKEYAMELFGVPELPPLYENLTITDLHDPWPSIEQLTVQDIRAVEDLHLLGVAKPKCFKYVILGNGDLIISNQFSPLIPLSPDQQTHYNPNSISLSPAPITIGQNKYRLGRLPNNDLIYFDQEGKKPLYLKVSLKHPELARGEPVVFAGDFYVLNGKIISDYHPSGKFGVDNWTGHYRCGHNGQLVKHVFVRHGFTPEEVLFRDRASDELRGKTCLSPRIIQPNSHNLHLYGVTTLLPDHKNHCSPQLLFPRHNRELWHTPPLRISNNGLLSGPAVQPKSVFFPISNRNPWSGRTFKWLNPVIDVTNQSSIRPIAKPNQGRLLSFRPFIFMYHFYENVGYCDNLFHNDPNTDKWAPENVQIAALTTCMEFGFKSILFNAGAGFLIIPFLTLASFVATTPDSLQAYNEKIRELDPTTAPTLSQDEMDHNLIVYGNPWGEWGKQRMPNEEVLEAYLLERLLRPVGDFMNWAKKKCVLSIGALYGLHEAIGSPTEATFQALNNLNQAHLDLKRCHPTLTPHHHGNILADPSFAPAPTLPATTRFDDFSIDCRTGRFNQGLWNASDTSLPPFANDSFDPERSFSVLDSPDFSLERSAKKTISESCNPTLSRPDDSSDTPHSAKTPLPFDPSIKKEIERSKPPAFQFEGFSLGLFGAPGAGFSVVLGASWQFGPAATPFLVGAAILVGAAEWLYSKRIQRKREKWNKRVKRQSKHIQSEMEEAYKLYEAVEALWEDYINATTPEEKKAVWDKLLVAIKKCADYLQGIEEDFEDYLHGKKIDYPGKHHPHHKSKAEKPTKQYLKDCLKDIHQMQTGLIGLANQANYSKEFDDLIDFYNDHINKKNQLIKQLFNKEISKEEFAKNWKTLTDQGVTDYQAHVQKLQANQAHDTANNDCLTEIANGILSTDSYHKNLFIYDNHELMNLYTNNVNEKNDLIDKLFNGSISLEDFKKQWSASSEKNQSSFDQLSAQLLSNPEHCTDEEYRNIMEEIKRDIHSDNSFYGTQALYLLKRIDAGEVPTRDTLEAIRELTRKMTDSKQREFILFSAACVANEHNQIDIETECYAEILRHNPANEDAFARLLQLPPNETTAQLIDQYKSGFASSPRIQALCNYYAAVKSNEIHDLAEAFNQLKTLENIFERDFYLSLCLSELEKKTRDQFMIALKTTHPDAIELAHLPEWQAVLKAKLEARLELNKKAEPDESGTENNLTVDNQAKAHKEQEISLVYQEISSRLHYTTNEDSFIAIKYLNYTHLGLDVGCRWLSTLFDPSVSEHKIRSLQHVNQIGSDLLQLYKNDYRNKIADHSPTLETVIDNMPELTVEEQNLLQKIVKEGSPADLQVSITALLEKYKGTALTCRLIVSLSDFMFYRMYVHYENNPENNHLRFDDWLKSKIEKDWMSRVLNNISIGLKKGLSVFNATELINHFVQLMMITTNPFLLTKQALTTLFSLPYFIHFVDWLFGPTNGIEVTDRNKIILRSSIHHFLETDFLQILTLHEETMLIGIKELFDQSKCLSNLGIATFLLGANSPVSNAIFIGKCLYSFSQALSHSTDEANFYRVQNIQNEIDHVLQTFDATSDISQQQALRMKIGSLYRALKQATLSYGGKHPARHLVYIEALFKQYQYENKLECKAYDPKSGHYSAAQAIAAYTKESPAQLSNLVADYVLNKTKNMFDALLIAVANAKGIWLDRLIRLFPYKQTNSHKDTILATKICS